MRREVRAIRKPRGPLKDVDLQHVTGLRTGDSDRAGQNVWARPAVVYPLEHVTDAGVHQQVRSITGVVGQCLDGDESPRRDRERRGQPRVEKAPMHRLRGGREQMNGRSHATVAARGLRAVGLMHWITTPTILPAGYHSGAPRRVLTCKSRAHLPRQLAHANAFSVSPAVSAPVAAETAAVAVAAKAVVAVAAVAADVIALGVRISRGIL